MRDRTAEIQREASAYFRSKEFNPYFKKLHRPPRVRYVLAALFALTGVGIPAALGLAGSAWWDSRKRKRARKELVEAAGRMVPIKAYALMANVAVTRGTGNIAPGLVIGSFDPDLNGPPDEMLRIGEAIFDALGEDEAVDALFADETYTPDRRRRLPDHLTGGREVYAFDLMIVGDFLPDQKVERLLIPCLAEPGPAGRIVAFPWSIVPGWILADLIGPTGARSDHTRAG